VDEYLNGYGKERTTKFVPPGWDVWRERLGGNSGATYDVNHNGTVKSFDRSELHETDLYSREAEQLVRNRAGGAPWRRHFGPDGKRRYVSAKKKGDAERALRQAMTDADRGLVFEAGTLTVEDYLNRRLADSVKDTVRGTTFERYEQITRRHIVPEIGRVKLKAITPAHARGLARPVQGEVGVRALPADRALRPRNASQSAKAGRARRAGPAQRCEGRQAPAGQA
jgi:Phage integrase, N-terminal SAM-like domain